MSSRLNPRDYDLGELRDAVRETPRRGDGRRGGRRDDGRRDAHRGDRRADDASNGDQSEHGSPSNGTDPTGEQLSNGGSQETNGSSGGASRDDVPPPSADAEVDDGASSGGAAEGQYQGGDRSETDSAPGPSDDGRAGRRAGTPRERDDRPAVGRMRRNRERFARPSSRDRTADGAPRRREDAEGGGTSGWQPWNRAGRSGRTDRSASGSTARRATRAGTGGFELLSGGSAGAVERPYLDRLPDGYRAQVEIFAWLEELLATGGRASTLEALEYYEAVGWLSEESRERLEAFLEGLTAAEPPDPRPLDVDDHRTSLRYVARLAHRVDR